MKIMKAPGVDQWDIFKLRDAEGSLELRNQKNE